MLDDLYQRGETRSARATRAATTRRGVKLPADLRVIERSWLSSNNILIGRTLVDTGYTSESARTLELVDAALGGAPLEAILNSHCHSDHIGGNAALKRRYHCPITVPAGAAPMIEAWDERALVLSYADQECERFEFDATCAAGQTLRIGAREWQALGAPGHDPHALVFYSPEERLLISADALWENGFGVIFGALAGARAEFAETRATLEAIAALGARIVIPGHGRVFSKVDAALERAFARLDAYERDPQKHARHALKVMVMFALLARGVIDDLPGYIARVPFLVDVNARWLGLAPEVLATLVGAELERAGVAQYTRGVLRPRR